MSPPAVPSLDKGIPAPQPVGVVWLHPDMEARIIRIEARARTVTWLLTVIAIFIVALAIAVYFQPPPVVQIVR